MAVSKKKKIFPSITYNAPVTLTFCFISTAVLCITTSFLPGLTRVFFTASARDTFQAVQPLEYVRFLTHVFGHLDWTQFIGNFLFILLLGPTLEQRYGSVALCIMIGITAFVSAVLNVCFMSSALLGANGIVFMMILLSAFGTMEKNELALSFVLIVILYLMREMISVFQSNNMSEFAQLAGGLFGSLFGFFAPDPHHRPRTQARTARNVSSVVKSDMSKNIPKASDQKAIHSDKAEL